MKKTTDSKLLAKYLSGECNSTENKRVEDWIHADPENKQFFNLMKLSWNSPERESATTNKQELWKNLTDKIDTIERSPAYSSDINPAQRPFINRPAHKLVFRYAAVFVILITMALFFSRNFIFSLSETKMGSLQTIRIENGNKQIMTLADGSTVTLDAGSRLSYPERFTGNTREVNLAGEGYFEIAPNAEKPFIIHTQHARIKVLGTKFNIRSWEPEKNIVVAVAEGTVSLQAGDEETGASVIITGGQFSIITEGRQPEIPQSADVTKFLGWMHKEAQFKNAALTDILFQLERWYNVRFEVHNSSLRTEHLDIHLQNQSLKEILELISILTDSRYTQDGNIITISTN